MRGRVLAISLVVIAPVDAQCVGTFLGDFPGRPPVAPAMTLLGLGIRGKMATDSSLAPKGPVAEAIWEEIQADGKAQAGVLERITTEFDEQGREISRNDTQDAAEVRTVTKYQQERVVAVTVTTLRDGKPNGPMAWNYWTYNATGQLIDYRRGLGDEIQNHCTNFKYDERGRLTGVEYHEGGDDALWGRSEYKYMADGKIIEGTEYKDNDRFLWYRLNLDDHGRAVHVEVHNWSSKTKQWKAPENVAFKYDEKGRLVEQWSDAQDPGGPGSEHSIPPGKVTLTYDDANHTQEISWSDGKELLQFNARFDEAGAVIGLTSTLDGETDGYKLECTYDSRGNWTECRRWVTHDGQREMNRLWRRMITYR